MKPVIILLFAFCYVESRKILQPLDKNANVAFINMEGGGGVRPAPTTKPVAQATPVKPAVLTPVPTPAPVNKPPSPPASPKEPVKPAAPVTPAKPAHYRPKLKNKGHRAQSRKIDLKKILLARK